MFSSPLKRTYNTARIICDNDIETDERIIERAIGKLEGKSRKKMKVDVDFNDPLGERLGIENTIDFRKRINSFCEDVKNNYKGKNVLIVTHAGVSIYARCFFEGDPLDGNYSSYKLKNCEMIEYENK